MKNIEKRTIKNLTFDEMEKEKINVGKAIATEVLLSIGVSALSTLTFGGGDIILAKIASGTPSQITARYRAKNNATDKEKEEMETLTKWQNREYNNRYR